MMMPFEYYVRSPVATAAKGGRSIAKGMREIFTIIRGFSPPPLSGMKRWKPALIGHAIGIPLTYSINDDAL